MNCFQNLVSLIRQTTFTLFNLPRNGCELLSKLSIFDTTNNFRSNSTHRTTVVNCFQNLVSLIRQTTPAKVVLCILCCELLSKLSIFDTTNNTATIQLRLEDVVNCFQNLVSLIRQTTSLHPNSLMYSL